jgi:hypothetical protein
MRKEIKTLLGIMNLDDSNEVIPSNNHKEARNGVFRGNNGMMKFQSIRGNIKITNSNLKTNDRT